MAHSKHWITLNWTELQCTVPYCTALHCTALLCTVQQYSTLKCTAPYCTALHCTILHCTLLYCWVLLCSFQPKPQRSGDSFCLLDSSGDLKYCSPILYKIYRCTVLNCILNTNAQCTNVQRRHLHSVQLYSVQMLCVQMLSVQLHHPGIGCRMRNPSNEQHGTFEPGELYCGFIQKNCTLDLSRRIVRIEVSRQGKYKVHCNLVGPPVKLTP